MYTLLYLKWKTNKGLLYSTWNSTQCYMPAGWEVDLGKNGYMYMYAWYFYQHFVYIMSIWIYGLPWWLSDNLPTNAGDANLIPEWGRSPEGMATHSNMLPWRTPWTEDPGRLQSIGPQRVRHDLATKQQTTSHEYTLCTSFVKLITKYSL